MSLRRFVAASFIILQSHPAEPGCCREANPIITVSSNYHSDFSQQRIMQNIMEKAKRHHKSEHVAIDEDSQDSEPELEITDEEHAVLLQCFEEVNRKAFEDQREEMLRYFRPTFKLENDFQIV